MRQRTSEINIRVFKTEKEQIRRKANKAGMTMSDYLRNVALDKEIKTAPTEDFMSIYNLVKEIHDDFKWEVGYGNLNQKFDKIENSLLNLYHGKDGDAYGSDQDMVD